MLLGSRWARRSCLLTLWAPMCPAGRASYPSSALMNVIPAKVAGVSRIVVCTPPKADGSITPLTLVAADMAGADEIYKLGGAQAIAAMALGTDNLDGCKRSWGRAMSMSLQPRCLSGAAWRSTFLRVPARFSSWPIGPPTGGDRCRHDRPGRA